MPLVTPPVIRGQGSDKLQGHWLNSELSYGLINKDMFLEILASKLMDSYQVHPSLVEICSDVSV